MVLNILIPDVDSKPSSTKDAVISILVSDWPLTMRVIYNKIRKKFGYANSYQAVYKSVKELLEKNVLLEKDKRYEINTEWIKDVQTFTDIVETNYYAKEKIQSMSGLKESKKHEDVMILNFESIFDAEKYLYYFMKYYLFKTKSDDVCYCTNAEWRPIFYLRSEYNYYTRLMKRGHKFFFLCSGNSPLEQLCRRFYKSLGINSKHTPETFMNDTLVFGDYCINIFIPEDMKQKLRKLLEKQKIDSLLTDILGAKSSIRMVITKDPSLAQELKKQVTSKFK